MCCYQLGVNDLVSEFVYYDNYEEIIPYYLPFAKRTNNALEILQTGSVPSVWQNNMENSINLAMQNTIGKVLNDNATRGVLDSSVTTQSLYDIERNAADEVARQYHANKKNLTRKLFCARVINVKITY